MKICACILTLFIAQTSFALPNYFQPQKYAELSNVKTKLMSKAIHKKLARAHSSLSRNEYSQALSILTKLEKTVEDRHFELAQVHQTKAFVFAQQEKYSQAIKEFQKALDLKTLPAGPSLTSMYTVAQLYMAQGQVAKAKSALLEWFSYVEKPSAQSYILMATILSEESKKEAALEYVDAAIALSKKPQESWLRFSAALNFELKRYEPAAKSLKILTSLHPENKDYWKQLTGAYLSLSQESKALSTLALANEWGHLNEESELKNLASLLIMQNNPYWSAKFLETMLQEGKLPRNKRNLEMVAQAWLQAEELDRAIEPLASAAQLSEDGKLFVQLGQIYLEKQNYTEAVKAFDSSLKKANLKNPAQVHLAKGIALYYKKDLAAAKESFLQAKTNHKTQNAAEQWLLNL